MDDQTVIFTKTPPTNDKNHISPDYQAVSVKPGDTITFTNSLQAPQSDIEISFYSTEEGQKTSTALINEFCKGGGTSIKVDKFQAGTPGTYECEVNVSDATYLYDVVAGANYADLDPVIIIDKPGFEFMMLFAVVAGAGLALIGQRLVMSMRSNDGNSNRPDEEAT